MKLANATLPPPAETAEQDTELVRELAEESAVEFADERIKYVTVQITTATWNKLQARYAAMSATLPPSAAKEKK